MLRVDVSKDVLTWALRRSGDINAVEKRFPKIGDWKTGKSQPTFHQVEELAKATLTPFGYFFLTKPPEDSLPIPHFRTLRDKHVAQPSANLVDTVYTMERRQSWMRDHLIYIGQDALPFVDSVAEKNDIHETARQIRKVLKLADSWASQFATWTDALGELRRRAEDIGILVAVNGVVGNNTHRKLDPNEFRGFVLVDEYAPLIFINGADSKAAQMFTLAHELAHVWLGISAAFDLRDMLPAKNDAEQVCNEIAAEFLVPEKELRTSWPTVKREPEPFETLAKQFKVSQLVIARRTLDLSLISKSVFLTFYQDYLQKEHLRSKTKEGGGDFYKNQRLRIGRRFSEAVIRAAKEGSLLYHDAYELTGLSGKTFEHYADVLRSLP